MTYESKFCPSGSENGCSLDRYTVGDQTFLSEHAAKQFADYKAYVEVGGSLTYADYKF